MDDHGGLPIPQKVWRIPAYRQIFGSPKSVPQVSAFCCGTLQTASGWVRC